MSSRMDKTLDIGKITNDIDKVAKMRKAIQDLKTVSESTRNRARVNLRDILAGIIGMTEEAIIDDLLVNALSAFGKYGKVRSNVFRSPSKFEEDAENDDEEKENTFSTILTPVVYGIITKSSTTRQSISPENRQFAVNLFGDAKRGNGEQYTDSQIRKAICDALDHCGVLIIRPDQLKDWVNRKDIPRQKPGPKVNAQFEQMIWGRLMICTEFTDVDTNEKKYKVVLDCVYNYSIIKCAAEFVKSLPIWRDNEQVQDLTFSKCWISKFLQRNNLTRRRITSIRKMPLESVIKNSLKGNQNRLIQFLFRAFQIINVDETKYTYESGPTYKFVPKDAERAYAEDGVDEKDGFTIMVGVSGTGDFPPVMIILKHSEARLDERNMTVCTRMLSPRTPKREQLSIDNWKSKVYHKKIMRDNKEVDVYVNYLIDKSGNIITSQEKHWMDEIRFLMYTDLILKPYRAKVGGKLAVWMDNHTAHGTSNVISNLGDICTCFLPPNTTAALQILDLLINGPIKAHIRKEKATKIFEAFQEKRREYFQMAETDRDKLEFKMPRTTKAEAITNFLKWLQEHCQENEKMKKKVKEKFCELGMAPKENDNGDLEWTDIERLSAGVNCGTVSNFCTEYLDIDEGPENDNNDDDDYDYYNDYDNETTQV